VPPEQSHVAQPVLVCTCHIHWDPEFCDVKLIQTMMLMRELEGIIANSGYRLVGSDDPLRPNDVHTLLCGDFNSLPNSGTQFRRRRRDPTLTPFFLFLFFGELAS
jgi:CCR4-NOT transcription complex subunit 6